MRIALYHGYELTGSGSNEYVRYLARALADLGHDVHVLCTDPHPEAHDFVRRVVRGYDAGAETVHDVRPAGTAGVTVHVLPRPSPFPVYLTDKPRPGDVRAFVDLDDDALERFRTTMERAVTRVLDRVHPEVLHANHLVDQPVIASRACATTDIPWIVFPHGSAIEYTVRRDTRFQRAAAAALQACHGLVCGSAEVHARIDTLFPELVPQLASKRWTVSVGVDTTLFTPEAPPWEAVREALADTSVRGVVPSGDRAPRFVLFVGSLTAGKGVQTLITAFAIARRHHPEAHLVIAGDGRFRPALEALVRAIDRGDVPRLREIAARGGELEGQPAFGPLRDLQAFLDAPGSARTLFDHGTALADQVHFTGRLEHARLRLLYPHATVAAFPSIVPEAYPLVLLEAMANGVPALVTDTAGLREGMQALDDVLPPAWRARLSLPPDPATRVAGLAERLADLLHRPVPGTLRQALRRRAVERYDWKAVGRALVEVYERARRRPGTPAT